jgi:hypothetical protein
MGQVAVLATALLNAAATMQAHVEAMRDMTPSKGARGQLELSGPVGSDVRLSGLVQGDWSSMDWAAGLGPATVRQARGSAEVSFAPWEAAELRLRLGLATSMHHPMPEGELVFSQLQPGGWTVELSGRSQRSDDTVRVRQLDGRESGGEVALGWHSGEAFLWELRGSGRRLTWDGGQVTRWSSWTYILLRVLSIDALALKLGAAGAWADSSRDLNSITGSVPIGGGLYRYLDGNDPAFAPLDQWQAQGLATLSIAFDKRAFLSGKVSVPLWMRTRKTTLWPTEGDTAFPSQWGSSSWTRTGGGPWEGSVRLDLGLSESTWMALETSMSHGDDYWFQKIALSLQTTIF